MNFVQTSFFWASNNNLSEFKSEWRFRQTESKTDWSGSDDSSLYLIVCISKDGWSKRVTPNVIKKIEQRAFAVDLSPSLSFPSSPSEFVRVCWLGSIQAGTIPPSSSCSHLALLFYTFPLDQSWALWSRSWTPPPPNLTLSTQGLTKTIGQNYAQTECWSVVDLRNKAHWDCSACHPALNDSIMQEEGFRQVRRLRWICFLCWKQVRLQLFYFIFLDNVLFFFIAFTATSSDAKDEVEWGHSKNNSWCWTELWH